MKIILLILLICTSCAHRYKGLKGINKRQQLEQTLSLTEETKILSKQKDWITPKIFRKDDQSTWIIEEIKYDKMPMQYMCYTGAILPMALSFFTFGLIPIWETHELKGNLTLRHRETQEKRIIKFHGKMTSSFSIYNKLKIGKDPEWVGPEQNLRFDEYYQKYIQSKLNQ